MEGVGGRLGRSSSRYGTTTVFTGPVRRWKKTWVNVPPSNSAHHTAPANGPANGTNASSRLSLYKWTPITPGDNKDDDDPNGANADEIPKKKFKYIPIVALEEQNNEASEQNEDEATLTETDNIETTSKSDGFDEKPDINDLPMEDLENNDSEDENLNKSKFDLNLGLKARDGENKADSKAEQIEDNQLE